VCSLHRPWEIVRIRGGPVSPALRAYAEFERVLRAAGFQPGQVIPVAGSEFFAIEASPS
jgi:hypothetical protein